MRIAAVVLLLSMALAGCQTDVPGDPIVIDPDAPELDRVPDHWFDLTALPGFDGADQWLNTDGRSIDWVDLEGQVVLVDFWTYSCVNCIRTFPHITGLYDTYHDHGFTLIGVHSPEFEFEEDPENVQEAIDRHGIHYPVRLDNEFTIWRDFQGPKGGYWPSHFLFDHEGHLRAYHRGEGGYLETEQLVRSLLAAAGQTDLPPPFEEDPGSRTWGTDITPELYAGYGRQDWTIGNDEGYHPQQTIHHEADGAPERDRIFLDGPWYHGKESLTAQTAGKVFLEFQAGAANFVADGPEGECIEVLFDGEPVPTHLAGPDVNVTEQRSCIFLESTPRSYDFYAGAVSKHEVGLLVPTGFELYTFAFSSYDQR